MTAGRSFLLDENVDVRVGKFLKEEGYDISFVPKGIRNGEVLALAQKDKRVLVTHDTDFLDAFSIHKDRSLIIVVIRIHPPTKEAVTAAFSALLPHLSSVQTPCVYELTSEGFRIHEIQT